MNLIKDITGLLSLQGSPLTMTPLRIAKTVTVSMSMTHPVIYRVKAAVRTHNRKFLAVAAAFYPLSYFGGTIGQKIKGERK